MLKYLKKFVLDILPSVAATIIGAYIVNHYVIPAAAPNHAPAAAVAPAETKTDAADKNSFAKGVAEKAAIERTAEKAAEKSADATGEARESRKRLPSPRIASRGTASDTTASVPDAALNERRDANELARAAIERLRPAAEPPRAVAVAMPTQLPHEPKSGMVAIAPPAASTPDVFDAGATPVTSTSRIPATVRSADASRPQPPADIPAAPPLELHVDAPSATRTVAEDVISAAKSVFHAVLPR